jgi:hypothetical protein
MPNDLADLERILGEVLKSAKAPPPRDHWEEFKKLAVAAERHRRECMSLESGAGRALQPATGRAAAPDFISQPQGKEVRDV